MDGLTLLVEGFPLKTYLILPLLLVGYHIFLTDASPRSKVTIAGLFVLSLAALVVVPRYWLGVLIWQVAVGVYIVFYVRWTGT